MKKFVAFLLLFALALVFVGCEKGGDVLPTEITITASSTEVEIGKTINLMAAVKPSDATNKAVTWSSSDSAKAEVNDKGVVTGVAEGDVEITATAKADSSVTAKLSIKVIPVKEEELAELTISGAATAIEGKPAQYKAVPKPASANKEVTWSLEAVGDVDPSTIAEISEDGVVTVKATGQVTIKAVSKVNDTIFATKTIDCVTVSDMVHPVELLITTTEYNVPVGKKQYISRQLVGPTDATGKTGKVSNTDLWWASSDESIATVDESGYVTAVAEGECTITCTTDDKKEDGSPYFTKTVSIKVYTPKAPTMWDVKFAATDSKIEKGFPIGETVNISITVGEEEDASAEFTSSNAEVASVDENGKVTAVAEGQAQITVTSAVDPTKTVTLDIKIILPNDGPIPEKIIISGENEMYVGYSQQLTCTAFPLTAVQTVTWKSSDETIATVDETGRVTGIKAGTVRIKATSTKDSKVVDNFRIKIEVEPPEPPKPDMGGYEIIIMNAESALSDNDPFLEKYTGSDKLFKQQAWREIESEYNCKITVTAYPADAPWGNTRINWIKEKASTRQSQCDLGIVSSNWIHEFAKSESAIDVTSYYNTYGKKQMDPAAKAAGSYHNKIYIASTGLTVTGVNVDLGLYYNYGLIKRLGIEDPATLFNEGRWNYTGFAEWVHTAQAKLGEGKNALGGHPYYYYYGMTNAAGVKIADVTLNETNIMSKASKNAMELMQTLTNDGCVSKANTWGEAKSTGTDPDFFDENVLMITGALWFVRATNRWHPDNGLNWEGTPEFGYVPFPYPDDVELSNTRIGVSGLSVYLYVAGRNYPAGVDAEAVYRAMNDMFLRTHRYQESDPTFNAREVVYNSLKTRIDNDASIEAIMFYDASRTMFDPAHGIYSSTAGTRLRQPSIDVMFNNKDFTETFGAVSGGYAEDFLSVYG